MWFRNAIAKGQRRVARLATGGPGHDCYYLGHHKCATNWMRAFLRQVTDLVRANYVVHGGDESHNVVVNERRSTFHLHVNSRREDLLRIPADEPGFHLIRDPRDALISDYFSRRNSHRVDTDAKQELRAYLRSHDLQAGLVRMMDACTYFQQVHNWPLGSRENVLDVRFEDCLQNTEAQFGRILRHLGVGMPRWLLRRIVASCSFSALSGGRQPGEEDVNAHYRKGVAGDWRNYMPLDSSLYAVFLEKHGALLERLGYE